MMNYLIGFGGAVLVALFLFVSLLFAMYACGDITIYKGK